MTTNARMRNTLLAAATVLAALAFLAIMALPHYFSNPGRGDEPYGGCAEGWAQGYLHGEGAEWCRAHGWVMEPDLLIGPDGTLVADDQGWYLDHRDEVERDRGPNDGW